MTSKRKNAFIVSSLALALGLFGGPAQAVPVLGLEQAYVSAIQKTETVPIAEATTRQAEELVSQAKGAIFPTINLVGTYTRQDTGNAPTSSFTDPVQYNARLNLNQPIFRGLREFAAVRGTNANYAAQVAAESQTRVELYRTVGDAFYGHLSAQQDLRNLNHLLELTEKRVAEINQRVRIGRSRNGESLTAQVQRSTVTAQLEAAKAVAAQAKRNFELVTGVSGEFSLQDSVQLPNPLPSVDAYFSRVESRYDVRAQVERVEASEAEVSVAWGAHLPSIDFGANYYLARTGVLRDTKWDVGLSATFPLFQGGVIQSEVREAAERRKVAELGLSRLRRTAQETILINYDFLVSTQKQIEAYKSALEISEKNYREQLRDYSLGLTTNLDVLQALNSFVDTQRALDKTQFTAKQAFIALETSVGSVPASAGLRSAQ